ncbi:MAG: hypothetical protein ACKOT0_00170, partial [bacterium]
MTTPEDPSTEAPEPAPEAWANAQARLARADPASDAPPPDVTGIRERVLAGGGSDTRDVASLQKRRGRGWLIGGSIAAGVVVLAGVALGGVALGRVTAPEGQAIAAGAPTAPEDVLPVLGAPSPPLPALPAPGQPQGAGMSSSGSAVMAEDAKSMP